MNNEVQSRISPFTRFDLQILVFALSTALELSLPIIVGYHIRIDNIPLYRKIFSILNRDFLMETILICLGWICLFAFPSYAALRCFRVYFLLRYFNAISPEESTFKPERSFMSLSKALRLSLYFVDELFNEFTTEKTKGRTKEFFCFYLLIFILPFYYFTFIFSLASCISFL